MKDFGKTLIVAGCILSLIGVALMLAKGKMTVAIMSLPVLLIGIVISHHSKKDPPRMKVH